jgi:hypothetical protein
MYISYSVVPEKKEDFNSCRVCRLFFVLAKKKVGSFFRPPAHLDEVPLSPQASTTPMESVTNRHLIQLNFISSQSTENNKVYFTYAAMKRIIRCLGCKEC